MRTYVKLMCAVIVMAALAVPASADIFVTTTSVESELLNHASYQTTNRGWFDNGAYSGGVGGDGTFAVGGDRYGNTRGLIRFTDLGALLGRRVTGATLDLYLNRWSGGPYTPIDHLVDAYPVTSDWNYKEAAWQSRTSTLDWTNLGGDIGSSMGSATFGASTGQWVQISLSASVVQGWIDTPATSNYGMMVFFDQNYSGAMLFDSAALTNKPTLTIDHDTRLLGDVNRDELVDNLDATTILGNWNMSGTYGVDIFHTDGDLNADGTVNNTDLLEVKANWGYGFVPPPEPPYGIPEPSTLLLLAGGVLAGLIRRG